jgi:2-dehydropantoate 2-reductase
MESSIEDNWPRIAVVGAGAVGCYFGGMLARAGAPVRFIGRAQHVDAMNRDGLFLRRADFQERVPVSASTVVEAAGEAEIVLFCVKTLDTEDAMKALAPCLAGDALVVSLQNGVDNVERIRSVAVIEAIPAVVYVAAEMTGPGTVQHNGRGDLIIGDPWGRPQTAAKLERLAAIFTRAGVPCRISVNIAADLWTKMIMNCAYNALSALCRSKYGKLANHPLTRDLMAQVVEEAVAVAGRLGVALSASSLFDTAVELGQAMQGATSSTAQDIARGKRTEIDSFNGYIVRRGLEFGTHTPVNKVLYATVKFLDENAPLPSRTVPVR